MVDMPPRQQLHSTLLPWKLIDRKEASSLISLNLVTKMYGVSAMDSNNLILMGNQEEQQEPVLFWGHLG